MGKREKRIFIMIDIALGLAAAGLITAYLLSRRRELIFVAFLAIGLLNITNGIMTRRISKAASAAFLVGGSLITAVMLFGLFFK